jgi:hypothetical protein
MAWLTPELYRCNLCRGEPTLRRLANFREVANRPGKRPAMSEAHTRVVRAAFARPGETCSEAMVREVMAAHSVPLAMVALRVTELRNTGPVVLPAGVKVGAIERPDGTIVPIVGLLADRTIIGKEQTHGRNRAARAVRWCARASGSSATPSARTGARGRSS